MAKQDSNQREVRQVLLVVVPWAMVWCVCAGACAFCVCACEVLLRMIPCHQSGHSEEMSKGFFFVVIT